MFFIKNDIFTLILYEITVSALTSCRKFSTTGIKDSFIIYLVKRKANRTNLCNFIAQFSLVRKFKYIRRTPTVLSFYLEPAVLFLPSL